MTNETTRTGTFESAAVDFLADHLHHFGFEPVDFEFEDTVYSMEEVAARLGRSKIEELRRQAFNWDEAHDYIASHGIGLPTNEARSVALDLFVTGVDYATIGHEITARGLTHQNEA